MEEVTQIKEGFFLVVIGKFLLIENFMILMPELLCEIDKARKNIANKKNGAK